MSTQDPPRRLIPIIRKMGPGMILAGSIVGSGELIATTLTGAKAGYSFIWIILIGCIIKVFTQIEITRYAISSGKTTLRSFLDLPGGKGIFAFWFAMFLVGFGQLGGIVGGVGQAMAISVPVTKTGKAFNTSMNEQMAKLIELKSSQAGIPTQAAEAVGTGGATTEADAVEEVMEAMAAIQKQHKPRDAMIWCIIIAVSTSIILFFGRFGFIEAFCVVIVAAFTFITIGNVIALQTHEAWAITMERLRADGLWWPREGGLSSFTIALAAFGIIGVGASEIVAYPYWCLEKGYGKWTGPRDDSEAWATRAKGWLRVMSYDAWGSMLLYTTSTIAFYLLGAAVLHRIQLVPDGSEMVRTLGLMYEPVFASIGKTIFLFGAFAVLFSTFFVANAQKARLMSDALAISLRLDIDEARRRHWVRIFSALFPLLCLGIYLLFPKKPATLVLLSGVMQSLMLAPLGFAAVWFRYKKTDRRLLPGRAWDAMLWISFACFILIGLYLAWDKLPSLPK